MLLKACLNGSRTPADHPRCPITPDELATDSAAAVAAGATALHVHPRDPAGREALDADTIGAAIAAIRSRVDVPIGVSTGAWFLPAADDRRRAIASWDVLPDFASVNFHEPGAQGVAGALLDRGIDVEAGIWTTEAAAELLRSGLVGRCVRVLIEPMEQTVEDARANVAAIVGRMRDVAPELRRLLHGCDATAWDMLGDAVELGFDIRIGLEDTLRLPDASAAADNAALVRAAAATARQLHLDAP